MNNFIFPLFLSYLLITCYFFSNWLRFSIRHPISSPEEKFLSFMMFVITSIFWPTLVPMCFVEIFKTRKLEYSTAVPVVIAVSTLSLALYMG